MTAFERLKEWSERFAETDAIAAEVKRVIDEYESLRASAIYARDQLAELADTDHYGNEVARAYLELVGALSTEEDVG